VLNNIHTEVNVTQYREKNASQLSVYEKSNNVYEMSFDPFTQTQFST
jgi:hypothetical protein